MTPTPAAVEVVDGRVVIDGVAHPELAPVPQHGLAAILRRNKKALLGGFGSLAMVAYAVAAQVPELSARWPVTVKVCLAILAAGGFAGAHASQPDQAAKGKP